MVMTRNDDTRYSGSDLRLTNLYPLICLQLCSFYVRVDPVEYVPEHGWIPGKYYSGIGPSSIYLDIFLFWIHFLLFYLSSLILRCEDDRVRGCFELTCLRVILAIRSGFECRETI